MSFDIFVQDLPPDALTTEDIAEDFIPKPIGLRADIIAAIQRVVPQVDFTDPQWGRIDGSDFSIEIAMGGEDPPEGFTCHVRGGEGALFLIAEILRELGLRALAPGTESGFFELGEATPAYERWRSFRNQVME